MALFKKLPSSARIRDNALNSVRRFPLALACAVCATVCAVLLADNLYPNTEPIFQRLLFASMLGAPLFFAIVVSHESYKLKLPITISLNVVALALVGLYFWLLPEEPQEVESEIIRFLILFAGAHFLLTVVPFLRRSEAEFCEFNKALALRFAMAVVYAGVCFIGLAIAMLAVDNLFDVDFREDRYLQLFIALSGILHPWITLAGVPEFAEAPDEGEEEVVAPRALKVVAQYILLPLVFIYAAILYAFMGKILIQWSWPEGWVSRLILWYAAVGTLMLLLLRPLTDQAAQRWVRTFETWYYRAMIPLAVVLPLALYRRFGEYGLTEARYLGFALAFALILVVIYFNIRKERDTRVIPAALALLGLVAGLGPWSAIALSRTDQLERFSALVTEHNITFEPGAPERRNDLPAETRAELSRGVRHLSRHYGLEALSPWLSDSVMQALKDTAQYTRSQEITRLMGFEFIFAAAPLRAGWVRLNAPETDALQVQGYDFVVRTRTLKPQPDTAELRIIDDSLTLSLVIDNDRQGVALWSNDPAADTFFISLAELIATYQTAPGSAEVGWDEMTFEGEGERLALRMYLRMLNLHIEDEKPYIQNLDADLVLRVQE